MSPQILSFDQKDSISPITLDFYRWLFNLAIGFIATLLINNLQLLYKPTAGEMATIK